MVPLLPGYPYVGDGAAVAGVIADECPSLDSRPRSEHADAVSRAVGSNCRSTGLPRNNPIGTSNAPPALRDWPRAPHAATRKQR